MIDCKPVKYKTYLGFLHEEPLKIMVKLTTMINNKIENALFKQKLLEQLETATIASAYYEDTLTYFPNVLWQEKMIGHALCKSCGDYELLDKDDFCKFCDYELTNKE